MGIWDRITGKEQIEILRTELETQRATGKEETRLLKQELEEQRAMTFEQYENVFGTLRSQSGVSVNDRSALSLCPWFSAVSLISDTIAGLPFEILQETETGNAKYKTNLWNLLNESANTYQSAFQFIRTMTGWSCHGNAFAEIQRNAQGQPIAFNPIPPDRVIPYVKELDGSLFSADMAGGRVLYITYQITLPSGEPVGWILGDDMLHLTGFSINGVKGLSITQTMKDTIGLGLAAEEYGNRFFSNGAIPEKALYVPGKISALDKEAMKKEWYKEHGGLNQAHRLAIIQNGGKLEDIGQGNDTNQFLETRKYTAEQVCQIFHIPPYLLSLVEKSAGNNSYEAQQRTFLLFTLLPFMANWRTELTRKALTEDERNNGVFIDHDTSVLLRGDTIQRFQAYALGLNNGFMCPNDVRRMENMNDIEGGNTFVRPMNMGQIGIEPPASEPAETQTDTIRSRMLPILNDTCGRITRRRDKDPQKNISEFMRTALQPLGFETAKLDNYINNYCQRKQSDTPEEMTKQLLELLN
jgi:HK97 family phage portal protein